MSRRVDPLPTGELLERLETRSTKFITYCMHKHGFSADDIHKSVVRSLALMLEGERQQAVIDYRLGTSEKQPTVSVKYQPMTKWQHFKELFK